MTRFFPIYFTITGAKKIVKIVHYTEDFVLWRSIISSFHCNIIIKWKDIRIPFKWNLFGTTFAWYYLFLKVFFFNCPLLGEKGLLCFGLYLFTSDSLGRIDIIKRS